MSALFTVLEKKIKNIMKKDEFNVEIGLVIKEVREDSGLNQEELALLLNMKRGKLGRIERGEASISAYELFMICNILDISDIKIKNAIQRKNKQQKIVKGKYEKIFYQLLMTTKLSESLYEYLIQTLELISGGKRK